MTVDKEALATKAADAMKALGEIQDLTKKHGEKLDALDLDKFNKASDDIGKAIEDSQKAQRAAQAADERAIAAETKMADLEKKLGSTEGQIDGLKAVLERMPLQTGSSNDKAAEAKEWNRAINAFARKSFAGQATLDEYLATAAEYKDLAVVSNPDGGYLVMPAIGELMRSRVIETSPLRPLATTITIGNDAIEFPTYNDRAALGGWVSEKQSRPQTTTVQFGKQRIGVYELYAEPAVTQKMIDDAQIDIEAFLLDESAAEFSRTENSAFVAGDGIEKPRGFTSYANYTTPGVFQQGAIEQIKTGAASAAITYDNLVDLQNALKQEYQSNATFLYKRATNAAILKIKNGNSDPIFNMTYDKNVSLQPTLLGRPVVFADDMPLAASGVKSVAYGDFKKGYTIVDRIGTRILRDPLTVKGFVLFYITKRVGGDVTNFEAIKLLNHAS